jgi:hypothetical protein
MTGGDLLNLIGRDTTLRKTSSYNGGEYSGPCPLCRRGTDRFKVWPKLGKWACLGPKAGRGGCDKGGDAIQYLCQMPPVTVPEIAGQCVPEMVGQSVPG